MLDEIFEQRKVLDRFRQPSFGDKLTNLITRLKSPHPYELSFVQQVTLFKDAACAPGAAGHSATLGPAQYLYRLEALPILMKILRWKKPASSNPKVVHEKLLLERRRIKHWLPLEEYAEGEIQNGRGFSWWTTHEHLTSNPYRAAHVLGLLDEWIPTRAVILRCRVRELDHPQHIRVPSPVDGFFSPIFMPARTDSRPVHGVTIDLDSEELRTGVPEFALRPLDVRIVDFIPVAIGPSARKPPRVQKGTALWKKLLSYYQAVSQ